MDAVETTSLVEMEEIPMEEKNFDTTPLFGSKEIGSEKTEDIELPHENKNKDVDLKKDEGKSSIEKKQKKKGGSSPLKICVNLLNTTLGAGSVCIPYAVSTAGIIAAPILLITFAFFSSYSLFLLLQASVHFKGLNSYRDIGTKVLKSNCMGKILELFIFANTFGILAGYIVIVGEYSSSLLVTWTSSRTKWVNDSFLGTQFLSFVVLYVLMFPLSLLRKMSLLSYTSACGLLSVAFVTILIIVRFFQLGCVPFDKWELEPVEFAEASTAIPLFIFAYSNHFAYLPMVGELPEGKVNIHMNSYVIFLVTVVCTIIYLLIGLFGYLLFGPLTTDNILMSFPNSDFLSQFGKVFILFVLIVSYPLIFFTSRNSILILFCGERGRNTNCCCWIFISLVLSLLTWGIAIAVPSVSVILGFTASTFFIVINFILPYITAMKMQKSWSMWIIHLFLCFVFAIVGIVSTVGVVMDYIEQTFL